MASPSTSATTTAATTVATPAAATVASPFYEDDGEIVLKVSHDFMKFPLGFVVDAGGSVTKVVYRSKKDYKAGQLIKPSEHGLLRLRYFKMSDIFQIIDFLKDHCDVISTGKGSGYEQATWHMTGVTAQHFKAKLEEEFEIKTSLCSEMMALQNSLKLMPELQLGFYGMNMESHLFAAKRVRAIAQAVSKFVELGDTTLENYDVSRILDGNGVSEDLEKLVISQSGPPEMEGAIFELMISSDDAKWAEKYLGSLTNELVVPSILTLFGSAAVTLLVSKDYKLKGVDFTSVAGKTLTGLSEELCGEKDFEKFMEMASRGDLNKVTTLVGDLKNEKHTEDDWYSWFPEEYPAFELGKLSSVNVKGKGTYSKEDLAAGILNVQVASIAKTALHNCLIHKVDHAYFAGSLMKYEVARKMISKHFLSDCFMLAMEGGPILKPFFIRQPGFLVAVGVWAANVEVTKNLEKK
ncbi:hypothetical protein HELRODRAFT_193939 [Helobdella robusta]|uniref:Uncharacterized protein n=1 Tax=Helobdella robusta TaxID=6412 RepID=T1FVH9_HELRO|nr:hypothetical protein HELRODRAFT_193939 [Helobdella robusta]ESN93734.1 hypothetical protein HELRODRAFT_193939 [Helobdella robusta]